MPYLTPDELPEATSCRSLLIPDNPDWLAIVSGAINELAKDWNWEQEGAVTTEEAAQAMLSMWMTFVDSDCASGTCARVFRIAITGEWEQSTDGGETWEAPTGDYTVPATPAREEPTADERICLAAANAANVLSLVYEDMIDAWQLDHEIDYGISVFAAAVIGLIGNWLGLIAVASINLALSVFAGAYEILDNLFQDAWDTDFNKQVVCLLRRAATDVSGVVTFDLGAFQASLTELETDNPIEAALLQLQISYMLLWIGGDGLNAAGATTAITTYDCETDCGTWDYWIPLEAFVNSDVYVPLNAASNTCGTAWTATPAGSIQNLITYGNGKSLQSTLVASIQRMALRVEIDLPADTTVTYIQFTTSGASVLRLKYNDVQVRCGAPASSSDWAPNQTGGLFQFNFAATSGATAFQLLRIRVMGTGTNPFLAKLGKSYPAP